MPGWLTVEVFRLITTVSGLILASVVSSWCMARWSRHIAEKKARQERNYKRAFVSRFQIYVMIISCVCFTGLGVGVLIYEEGWWTVLGLTIALLSMIGAYVMILALLPFNDLLWNDMELSGLGDGYLFYPSFKRSTMAWSDIATVGEESGSIFLESMLGERIYFAENFVGFSDFMTDLFDVRPDLFEDQEGPAL